MTRGVPHGWTRLAALLALVLGPLPPLGAAEATVPAAGAGFSTLDRVVYVQACMDEHPGPRFEMQSKCACVFDQLSASLSPAEFDELSTSSQALSIGGERGSVLRDNPQAQDQARRYRALQVQARQRCLLAQRGPRP